MKKEKKHQSKTIHWMFALAFIGILFTFSIEESMAQPPSTIAGMYENTQDWSVSDNFSSIDWNKWTYRRDENDGIGEGSKYVYIVNGQYLSLKGDKATLKGGGLSSLKSSQYGFYQFRFRTIGISKGVRTAWHPSIWGFFHNKGVTWKGNPSQDKRMELDIIEYYNTPVLTSHIIPHGANPVHKGHMIKEDPNITSAWRTIGCEYTPNYIQLWEYTGSWKKIGSKVWFSSVGPFTSTSNKIHVDHRQPQFWIFSNKYHTPEGKRDNTWLHLDYFYYYPYKTGGSSTPSGTPVGSWIWLKAYNGKYVCADKSLANTPLLANRSGLGAWEKFQVVDAGSGYIALKANSNGKYVSVRKNVSGAPLRAYQNYVGDWEKLTWETVGSGKVAFKAKANNKYVWSQNNQANAPLYAQGTSIKGWETFTWGATTKSAGVENTSSEFKVYPNPAKNVLNILLNGELHHDASVMIYNSTGKLVLSGLVTTNMYQVSTEQLTNGVYILKLVNGTNVNTQKLLIE